MKPELGEGFFPRRLEEIGPFRAADRAKCLEFAERAAGHGDGCEDSGGLIELEAIMKKV